MYNRKDTVEKIAKKLTHYLSIGAVRTIQYVVVIVVVAGLGVLTLKSTASSGVVLGDTAATENNDGRSIHITSPVSYQVVQRDGVTNRAAILVEGRYTGIPTAIEASWKGGPFRVIDTAPSGGTFSGSLVNQPAGQGMLVVRFVGDVASASTVPLVGVGDIFVMAGQSNMVGHGTSLQRYTSSGGIIATLFGNDDVWKELRDPYDSAEGQIDKVSADTKAGGSIAPLLASYIVAAERVPVAMIPVAKGGTSVERWQPGEPLYESMKRRIAAAGGSVRAVLWYQGENDSGRGMSRATYATQLGAIATQLTTDFPGTRMVVGQIGQSKRPPEALAAIRLAQSDLWQRHPSILQGPITHDIDLSDEGGDTLHFKSDADVELFAKRWWHAVGYGIYGYPSQRLPSSGKSCVGLDSVMIIPNRLCS